MTINLHNNRLCLRQVSWNLIKAFLLTPVLCCRSEALPIQAQVVSARAGQVCHAQGKVLYHRHEDQKDRGVRQLEVGTILNNGDIVFTNGSSYVEWLLTPDSYLRVANNSNVQVNETSLDHMRFDIIRGEVFITLHSLEKGAALVIKTPPSLLTISKPGIYRIVVAATGETSADVRKGELQYADSQGKLSTVKKGKRLRFHKAENSSRP